MMKNKNNRKIQFSSWVALVLMLIFSSCERDISDDATSATYANTADIFTDNPVGMGSNFYFPYGPDKTNSVGSKPKAWSVDNSVSYKGSASMRFDVPNSNDPEGNFAGALFKVDGTGRDLRGYDALTFWAKASEGVTISEIGFGESSTSVKIINVSLSTQWTKYIIPIPNSSILKQERGMLFYSAGAKQEKGYTFWIDELRFEKSGNIRLLEAKILNGQNLTNNTYTGASQTISDLSATYNLASGQNLSVSIAPSYLNFMSSDTNVATVNSAGLVNVIGLNGNSIITANLGDVQAKGSLKVTSNGVFPQSPTPTNPAANVRSIFSDAYTNIVSPNFNPGFGGSTTATTVSSLNGNNIATYSNNNYTGIMFDNSPIDASTMSFMHVDIFVESIPSTPIEFQIRDIGANKTIETNEFNGLPKGDDKDLRFTSTGLVAGQWNSINIPLTALTQKTNLGGIILVGGPNFILDNIYYYQ